MDDGEKARLKKELLQKLGLGSKEEAVAKGIANLTEDEKLEFITMITMGEDEELSTMLTIAADYELAWLEDWVIDKLKLRCSVNGWRANQIVSIAAEKRKEEGRFGFLGRIFKRGEGKSKLGNVEEFE
jgi:hypothetical protein